MQGNTGEEDQGRLPRSTAIEANMRGLKSEEVQDRGGLCEDSE